MTFFLFLCQAKKVSVTLLFACCGTQLVQNLHNMFLIKQITRDIYQYYNSKKVSHQEGGTKEQCHFRGCLKAWYFKYYFTFSQNNIYILLQNKYNLHKKCMVYYFVHGLYEISWVRQKMSSKSGMSHYYNKFFYINNKTVNLLFLLPGCSLFF